MENANRKRTDYRCLTISCAIALPTISRLLKTKSDQANGCHTMLNVTSTVDHFNELSLI